MTRCRMRRTGTSVLLAVAAAALLVAPTHARQDAGVRGRVLEDGSGRPLAGVFVALLDQDGRRQAGVLTNQDGWFLARAPAPGSYTLRFDLIGFAGVTSPPVTVGPGTTVVDDVHLVFEPIVLEGLDIVSEGARCRLPADAGAQTYRVWDEARKALTVAAWLEQDAGMAFQVMQHEYSRDIFSRELVQDLPAQLRFTSGVGATPFISADAGELAREGFVRPMPGGGHMYYGIDAATLLSAEFLENYCFRLVLPGRGRELLGLAFEPAVTSSNSDITGTLWLDAGSMEIRYLEYEYTRHPQMNAPPELFGGRVEFQRLPNRAWMVSNWWIRMPQAGPRQAPPGGTLGARATRLQVLRASGLTIREVGGSVRYTGLGDGAMAGDAADAATPGAIIQGTVYDSTRMRPLRGAIVFAEGVTATAVTDGAGRFTLRGLPEGAHRVGFLHAYTDSLALSVVTRAVSTSAAAPGTVALHVPASAACAPSEPGAGSAGQDVALTGQGATPAASVAGPSVLVVGFVVDRHGQAAAGVQVTAVWHEPAPSYTVGDARRGTPRDVRRQARVASDGNGRFVVCGLPPLTEVVLQPARGRNVTVETGAAGITQQLLVVR